MSGVPTNWRIIDNAGDWMRQHEKRAMHEARRPKVTHAADLMGPGLAPYAVEVKDWNAEETEFNGFFFSAPNALHSPDATMWWMGTSIAQVEGFGLQQVWDYRATTVPVVMKVRRFSVVSGVRVFSVWG